MASNMCTSLGENHTPEDSIEFHYREGLSYYERSIEVLRDTTIVNAKMVAEAFRMEAIKYLSKTLENPDYRAEDPIKIRSLLLLVKLYHAKGMKEDKEECFYSAVELTNKHVGEGVRNAPEWKEIITTYLSDIHPDFQKIFKSKHRGFSSKILLETVILPEGKRRMLEQELKERKSKERELKEMQYIRTYLSTVRLSDEILEKLKNMFGTIRLLIISENSGEAIIKHGFGESEVGALRKNPTDARYTTVDIFDKPRKYMVMMDCGELLDGFEEYHPDSIVNVMIDEFIKRREGELFRHAIGNGNEIEAIEKCMGGLSEGNDYSVFMGDVIERYMDSMEFFESGEEKDGYIDTFLKALDICRSITFHYGKSEMPRFANVSREIDRILGGKIERRVFSMVKSMLLSRSETMNGSGYPFGLSKKHISLEGRIYAIIRAYEALSSCKNPKQTIESIQEWAQGGNLDSEILGVFIKHLDNGIPSKSSGKIQDDVPAISAYRFFRCASFAQSCLDLLDIANDIKDAYHKGRVAEEDIEVQNIWFKKANELRVELLRKADLRKIIIITRHGETISDGPDGIPGNENELLIERGQESSLRKGILFQGLHLRIFTSPLIRGRQTAAIICQKVRDCVQDIIPLEDIESYTIPTCGSCPAVIIEETITNPKKNQENDRYDDLLSKFIADDNTKGLGEFLKKLVSSGEETMNLFITHRDSGRHLIFWLSNIFSQEQIFGKKTPIGNDTIYEFLFRGARLVSGEDRKGGDILFSFRTWKAVVSEFNILTEKVFGKTFYDLSDRRVNLIALHDRFLDFLDFEGERDPEALALFMEQVKRNSELKHLYPILEREEMTDYENIPE
ncbi:MAG: histidine phosphatase family protein [Candidatus Gracilibacteria bacterium]|nr:histidine phosphatase family protein [Candidatus Gracilibacteria bacterium]